MTHDNSVAHLGPIFEVNRAGPSRKLGTLNTGNWKDDFDFVKDLGSTTLNIIKETVSSKKDLDWTEEENVRRTHGSTA